jgi:4-alpha-glucanotransferase
VQVLKLDALSRLWAAFAGDPAFDDYVTEQGAALSQFAAFCALSEHHRTPWTEWPSEHRRPESPGVERFAAAQRDRVCFHRWLQWLLDQQLAKAGEELPILADLAVGVDPQGADSWAWQDVFAHGARIGAPPDAFNTEGQDWGLPPFVPWKLRAAGYEPLIQTLRGALRHARGLRIDHVMGLFRLFWVPASGTPSDGTYVRYPGRELLDIVALESVRAGAMIVGEDLGTVEDEARTSLADAGILSYRLLWFEPEPPERFPEQALAAVTTHDLPTVAGLWTGNDLAAQHSIGLQPSDEATAAVRAHLAEVAGVPEEASVADVVRGAYRALASAPSAVVTAMLDDALGVRERPNMPGTTHQWPNWCLALPAPLDTVESDPVVKDVMAALNRRPSGSDPHAQVAE